MKLAQILILLVITSSILSMIIKEQRVLKDKSTNKLKKNSSKQTLVQQAFVYNGSYFVATHSIGTPPQSVQMVLDAGSCEMGVSSAACTNCVASGYNPGVFDQTKSTSFALANPPQNVQLCYGTGAACNTGYIGSDTVNFAGTNIPNVQMSLDTSLTSPANTSGITGLCGNFANYVKTKKQPATSLIPLIVKSNNLTSNVFAFEITNWSAASAAAASIKAPIPGTLTIGGWNTAKFPSPTFFPNTGTGYFWQISSLVSVNGIPLPTGTTQLLTIDSGAPGQNLPTYLYNNAAFLLSLTTGGVCSFLASTSVQCTCTSLAQMNPLVYNLGGTSFTIPNTAYASYSNGICSTQLNYNDTDSKLGGPMFKSHYVVFDYDTPSVGFAPYAAAYASK